MNVLCCAVLCCAVLCCAVLCCAVLRGSERVCDHEGEEGFHGQQGCGPYLSAQCQGLGRQRCYSSRPVTPAKVGQGLLVHTWLVRFYLSNYAALKHLLPPPLCLV